MIKYRLKIVFLLVFLTSCNSSQFISLEKRIGVVTQERLFKIKPDWKIRYDQYRVNGKTRIDDEKLHFIILAATWCHDSSREIPRLLKVLTEYRINNSQVKIYLIAERKKESESILKKYNAFFTPTIVILYEGKEIKRFVENPNTNWENDLKKIAINLGSK